MKFSIILACSLLQILTGSAQEKKDTVLVVTRDTSSYHKSRVDIRIGKVELRDSSRKDAKPSPKFSFKFILSSVDVGLSTYLDQGSFTLSPANAFLEKETWKSRNFGFQALQMGYRFDKSFKIFASAGFDWNKMYLKQNITLQKDQANLTYVTESVDYKKNIFTSQYLRIPLSFEFSKSTSGKKIHLAFGPEIGFLLNGKLVQVSKENGRDKFKDDYNLNPFRYGAFYRVVYGNMGIYAKYYLNDVFADGQGPKDFKNLSFGLTFGY